MMSAVRPGLTDAALLAALVSLLAATTTASRTFRNPINTGSDPFITYFNRQYHLTTTQGDSIKMWSSPSLVTILQADPITIWRDTNPTRNKNIWAPEFHRLNGLWYMYYTADDGVDANHRIYVLESQWDDPRGPYRFRGRLYPPNHANHFSIDPTIMIHNGRLYLAYSGVTDYHPVGLIIAPLANPYTIAGNAIALNAGGGCSEVRQAPQFIYRNGRTWMTYSACDTGKPDYQIWMVSLAANADPMNPRNWVQHAGPIFSRANDNGVYGPGHHGFFRSPDGREDWMVYHAKTTSEYTYTDRTTRAKKITWNNDGSPNLGVPKGLGITQDLPSGDPGSGNYWINNDGTSSGNGTVTYSGYWHTSYGCGLKCLLGEDHWINVADRTATFTFTGERIALLNVRDTDFGFAAISIDDGPEEKVDYYGAIRTGETLTYMSPRLSYGRHKLRVRVTGEKNSKSTDTNIDIDRAEVYTDVSGRYHV